MERPKKARRQVARLVGKAVSIDRAFSRLPDHQSRLALMLVGVATAPDEVLPLPAQEWPQRYGITALTGDDLDRAAGAWIDAGLATCVEGGLLLTCEWLGRAAFDYQYRQWGNWISRAERHAIYARDGYACRYCGSVDRLTLDHVQPVSRGGSDDPANLVTCCRSCNSRKHARTPREAGMQLRPLARTES